VSTDSQTGGWGVLWAIGAASVVSRTLANDVGFHRNGAGGAVQFVVQTAAKTLRLETVKKMSDINRHTPSCPRCPSSRAESQ